MLSLRHTADADLGALGRAFSGYEFWGHLQRGLPPSQFPRTRLVTYRIGTPTSCRRLADRRLATQYRGWCLTAFD
jgi:hypothetical protein